MSEFAPITDCATLGLQDADDLQAGYYAGVQGFPEPQGSYFSRAFIHAWRGGAIEAGHIEADAEYRLMSQALDLGRSCTDRLGIISAPFRMPMQ